MNYLFFDVETTGLSRSADILEFAAVLCDHHLDIKKVYNEYFLYDGEIPSSAIAIHGLTTQKLEFLAHRDFMSAASDIYDLVSAEDTYLCGHNVINYDLPVTKSSLNRCGYSLAADKEQCIDTLKLAKQKLPGSHKLEEALKTALKSTSVTMQEILDTFDSEIFRKHSPDADMRYHCALFDSFASYCLYMIIG